MANIEIMNTNKNPASRLITLPMDLFIRALYHPEVLTPFFIEPSGALSGLSGSGLIPGEQAR
jgi:hypothetical protein